MKYLYWTLYFLSLWVKSQWYNSRQLNFEVKPIFILFCGGFRNWNLFCFAIVILSHLRHRKTLIVGFWAWHGVSSMLCEINRLVGDQMWTFKQAAILMVHNIDWQHNERNLKKESKHLRLVYPIWHRFFNRPFYPFSMSLVRLSHVFVYRFVCLFVLWWDTIWWHRCLKCGYRDEERDSERVERVIDAINMIERNILLGASKWARAVPFDRMKQ